MATGAARYIEHLQLASAAFSEGSGSLSDAAGMTGDEARPSLAYGFQAMTSGFVQIKAPVRANARVRERHGGEANPLRSRVPHGRVGLCLNSGRSRAVHRPAWKADCRHTPPLD
jgi:hypothetical protein